MFAWRISSRKYALDRTGYGASIKGQRWNSANMRAIYAGLTPEIAALEKLVHTGSTLPLDLVITRISLPDDTSLYESPSYDSLPEDWEALPTSPTTASFGDSFLLEAKHLGLIVPSSIMPEARNIVINPDHPMMREVTIEIVREFIFDPRLRI